MSCSPFDLHDFFFGELPEEQRRQVETHLRSCEHCHDEVERLHATRAALLTVADVEIPQRVAFVSDKVFEPSPLARAWGAFWNSAARLGFVSSAMLAGALVIWSVSRPVPVAPPAAVTGVDTAAVERRIAESVKQAVAESEARQAERAGQLLAASEKRDVMERESLRIAMEENLSVMQKRFNRLYLASADLGGAR